MWLSTLDHHQAGSGSGLLSTTQQVGMALGMARAVAAGVLVLMLVGLVALPHRVRARDLDGELSPAGPEPERGLFLPR